MAITKLTGFTGEAEVMGRMVRVEFEEGSGLLLVGLSHEDALVALDTLAAKVLVGVNPVAAVASKMPEAKAPATGKGKKEKEPKPDALEQAKLLPDTAAASKVEEPKTEDVQTETPKPDNVVPIKAGPPEGVTPDLTKAKQLKEVLEILMEHHGIKTPEAMVAKCEELKATVPVLSRIADIPARVKRTMELLSA